MAARKGLRDVAAGERADSGEQIERFEHDGDGAVAPRPLQGLSGLAMCRFFKALLRDGRAADVAAEALEPSAVARWDGDLGVHAFAAALAHALILAGA